MVFIRNSFVLLFIILWVNVESDGYRILAVFPLNVRSHNLVFEGITKTLAKRGHQIDVITHFELKNPPKNYKTIINLSGTLEDLMNNWDFEILKIIHHRQFTTILEETYGNKICKLMSFEKIQNFIQNPPNDPPYDLVITEAFVANCFFGFGHFFKVPVVIISTTLQLSWMDDVFGNSNSLAFSLNVESKKFKFSSFWDRLENTLYNRLNKFKFLFITENPQTEAMRKYLRADIPNIREVERSVSLLLVNTHYSIFGVRPYTPSVIPIAGIHIEQNNEQLTPELQAWMDESKDGVIYFSSGTMIPIENLPKKVLLIIYATFSKIAPVRFLVRVVKKEKLPPGLPDNVRIMPWVPQIPVLSHNNTRLFITHCGLNGIHEAIYFAVPMLGFPLFGDQILNVNILTEKNIGLKLDYEDVTEKSLNETLNALLYNPKYRAAAKYQSHLFRDRPMNATQTTIFWVEYIMRHGPNSLKSPAVDLYWWQVELLDVYGFLTICIMLGIYIAFIIFKSLIRLMKNILRTKCKSHNKKE